MFLPLPSLYGPAFARPNKNIKRDVTDMPEILGATLLGLIVQGIIYKILKTRSVPTLIALGISTVAYALPYIAIGTFRLAEDSEKDLMHVASIGIPAALMASVVIYAIIWSQTPATE